MCTSHIAHRKSLLNIHILTGLQLASYTQTNVPIFPVPIVIFHQIHYHLKMINMCKDWRRFSKKGALLYSCYFWLFFSSFVSFNGSGSRKISIYFPPDSKCIELIYKNTKMQRRKKKKYHKIQQSNKVWIRIRIFLCLLTFDWMPVHSFIQ